MFGFEEGYSLELCEKNKTDKKILQNTSPKGNEKDILVP